MSSKLGRVVALSVSGAVLIVASASAAGAAPGDGSTTTEPATSEPTTTLSATTTTDSSTTTTTTSTTTNPPSTTTTTSTTSTTTTTVPAPLVIELPPPPSRITPSRGSQQQVTDTLPPPPTTTSLPPHLVLPPGSGDGRRVVYSKSRQRVWTVEANGAISKTHLVSGRLTWNQPKPGTYSVFSRSSYTCSIKNRDVCWRYMVRFTKGPGGDNIGFHQIPTNLRTGRKLQSVSQLGTALSAGCVRQSTPDAQYMWGWAPIGTKVVVTR